MEEFLTLETPKYNLRESVLLSQIIKVFFLN